MTSNDDKLFRSSVLENDSVSLGAAETMTFHMSNGTDDATNRYLNMDSGVSFGLEVVPTVACSITEINGRTFKAPLSVGTGGLRAQHIRLTRFTVEAGSATVVEVFAKGG